LILPANFVENPENLVKSAFGDDLLDKISTLFIFVIIILFFGGGVIFTLEKKIRKEMLYNNIQKNQLNVPKQKNVQLEAIH